MTQAKDILVATTEGLVGYEIEQTIGEVFGTTSRSRNIISLAGAGLKSIVGGKIGAFKKLVDTQREESIEELKHNAAQIGADAVVMMRFDTETMSGIGTTVAYGTAVKLKK